MFFPASIAPCEIPQTQRAFQISGIGVVLTAYSVRDLSGSHSTCRGPGSSRTRNTSACHHSKTEPPQVSKLSLGTWSISQSRIKDNVKSRAVYMLLHSALGVFLSSYRADSRHPLIANNPDAASEERMRCDSLQPALGLGIATARGRH